MLNCTELCYTSRPPPLEELCYTLRPPPLSPESYNASMYDVLLSYAEKDPTYKQYHVTTSSPTSTLLSTSTLSSALESSSTVTSYVNQTVGLEPSDTDNESSVAKAGSSLAAVLVPIFIVAALLIVGFLGFYWKKKKKGRQASVALPLKTYQDTNYLDNKARLSLCWKGAEVTPPHDTTMQVSGTQNVYVPYHSSTGHGDYYKQTDKISNKKEKESPRFDKLNISQNSSTQPTSGFVNENFEMESDLNGTRSPGASSQTPLFDDVDGALPNSPIANGTLSKDNLEKRGSSSEHPEKRGSGSGNLSPEKNGFRNFSPDKTSSEKILPRGRLPPVELRKEKLNSSSTSIGNNSKSGSPKKCKKPVYLRKSEPLGNINKDIGDNRKSC